MRHTLVTNNNNLFYLLLISLLLLAHFAHIPVKFFLQAGYTPECVNIDANTTAEREIETKRQGGVNISSFKRKNFIKHTKTTPNNYILLITYSNHATFIFYETQKKDN